MINYNRVIENHKHEVNKVNGYKYIKSYFKGDMLPNEKIANTSYIEVIHEFCNNTYTVRFTDFKNGSRCVKCCNNHVNSFGYYLEHKLMLKLEEVWDFENNTVNPYCISRNFTNHKVWLKCTETDYHGSYEIMCPNFIRAIIKSNTLGCPYCVNKKVHPKDSFAQYHIDNTDPDFLEKYWDYEKNKVDPWEISPSCKQKVWIKCQSEEVNKLNGLMKKDYHCSYEISCDNLKIGNGCSYCSNSLIHTYDSFGYHNFDKVQSWHPDNKISPFRVARASSKKYKFICETCEHEWKVSLSNVSQGRWCSQCFKSKGEKKIKAWLDMNNIYYIYDEPYFKDLLSDLGNPLRPDFILPEHKIWIEYDGEFHYEDFYKDGSYETLKSNDKRKDKYSKENGWNLIRIPYWDFDNIEEILNKKVV